MDVDDGMTQGAPAACRPRAGSRLARLAVMALAVLAATPTARADSSDDVIVTARSFVAVPAGASIFVKVLDNSAANLELRGAIKRELAAQSRALADEAPLVLRFTTDHLENTQIGNPSDNDVERIGPQSNLPLVRGDDLGTSIPLETRAPRAPGETRVGAIRYRLHASLEQHDTGQVLWRGDAVGSLSHTDERTLGPQLATALIAQLGRTVEAPPR
jgi:hypothetical protein